MSSIKIIPQPSSITETGSQFVITKDFSISYSGDSADKAATLLQKYLRPATGFEFPITEGESGNIVIKTTSAPVYDEANFTNEVYSLSTNDGKIVIEAQNYVGAIRAIQTLRQILPPEIYSPSQQNVEWIVPGVVINDAPSYRWRGLHFDTVRHFFTIDEVKRFIELAAQHKFNMFHWHITDDQGWRIEIKKYPRLTEFGAWREKTMIGHEHRDRPRKYDNIPHGGFYTQEQIREVVAFAAERAITVMPEIDMPGHMSAAIACYPELGNGFNQNLKVRCHWHIAQEILNMEESTVQFCKDVWTELFDLFPSKFFHIGGDEAPRYEWFESDRIQELMAERGLKTEEELQAWFTRQINAHFRANGRRLIGWDEILEGGLEKTSAVMSWRGWRGAEDLLAATRAGHDVVVSNSNHFYFDYYQVPEGETHKEPLAIGGYTTLDRVYSFDIAHPDLSEEDLAHVLGGQGQVWTEYIGTFSHVEYMTYPRACALSEVLWTNKEQKNYEDFLNRLSGHIKRLDAQGVNAFKKA